MSHYFIEGPVYPTCQIMRQCTMAKTRHGRISAIDLVVGCVLGGE